MPNTHGRQLLVCTRMLCACCMCARALRGCLQGWNECGENMLIKRGVTFCPSSGGLTSAETDTHRGWAWVHLAPSEFRNSSPA